MSSNATSSSSGPEAAPETHGSQFGIYVAFVPLVLFSLITQHDARESVPRQFWGSPRFKRINRQLTALWGWVFVALIPSHIIAGAINTSD
jgi:hypothetical protein